MFATRVVHYRDPAAVILGLKELRKQGLTPRGLLFVALDPRGETYIAVPGDLDAVADIKVGDKLSLVPPWEGRYFHLDSVHRLPGDSVLWNGDRRLGDTGSAPEVACAISEWLKGSSAKNVFLGCTPHQPGAWWTPWGEEGRHPSFWRLTSSSRLVMGTWLPSKSSGAPRRAPRRPRPPAPSAGSRLVCASFPAMLRSPRGLACSPSSPGVPGARRLRAAQPSTRDAASIARRSSRERTSCSGVLIGKKRPLGPRRGTSRNCVGTNQESSW